jgi:hypothetical protein
MRQSRIVIVGLPGNGRPCLLPLWPTFPMKVDHEWCLLCQRPHMSKKLSCVWIIGGITLRFHTQLNILHRKDRFTAFDPHTTPYFAQNFNSLIHTQKRTGPKFALVCGQYIGISAFHGICLRKFQNVKKSFWEILL